MPKPSGLPNANEQALLDQVQVRLLQSSELQRCNRLLDQHHYLKRIRPVGQRLYYVATDAQGVVSENTVTVHQAASR